MARENSLITSRRFGLNIFREYSLAISYKNETQTQRRKRLKKLRAHRKKYGHWLR